MNISINNNSGVPIYEQIKEQIKDNIINNNDIDSNSLPSIRASSKRSS